MDKLLERLVNVAILVAAVCLVVLVTHTLVQRHETAAANQPLLHKGDTLSLGGGASAPVLLLALQTGCHFCKESMPFYERLSRDAQAGHAHLVFGFPQAASDDAAYLKANGVEAGDVREVNFDKVEVRGTPTLVLLDAGGRVQNYWIGKLPAEKEAEVEAAIR